MAYSDNGGQIFHRGYNELLANVVATHNVAFILDQKRNKTKNDDLAKDFVSLFR